MPYGQSSALHFRNATQDSIWYLVLSMHSLQFLIFCFGLFDVVPPLINIDASAHYLMKSTDRDKGEKHEHEVPKRRE